MMMSVAPEEGVLIFRPVITLCCGTDDGTCFYPGDTCDDGDINTSNDVVDSNCNCQGELAYGHRQRGLQFFFGCNRR